METSLLPQARFLLDSKANCIGTQKIPGISASLCYVQYFLCELTKARGFTCLESLIRIILFKS